MKTNSYDDDDMEFIEVLMIGLLAVLFLVFTITIWLVYSFRARILEEITHDLLNMVSNDEEMQKMLFQVGGIIGSGVKSGIGLPQASGTPRNLKQLGIQLLSQFLEGKIQVPQNPLSPANAYSPQDISSQKNRDKW